MYAKIIDNTTEALKNAENNRKSDSYNIEVFLVIISDIFFKGSILADKPQLICL